MTKFSFSPVRSLAVGLVLAGCSFPGARTAPSPETIAAEWSVVVDQAAVEVQSSRYASADRMLLDFQQRYQSSPQAQEASFYRALYKLDPGNPAASSHDAGALLESFLASTTVSPHRGDAAVLKRVAAALDAKPAVVTVTTPVKEVVVAAPKSDLVAKDEEIAKLKDDLAKANAELERIRRRLAMPKP